MSIQNNFKEDLRANRSMTPSRSSGSITPSRRPHRLPENINKELERKIGGQAALKAKNGKSSAESEGSPDEGFTITNRKKPGTLNDNVTRQRYFAYFVISMKFDNKSDILIGSD